MDRFPSLTAVRAFEAAGRHENFSRAAEELGMTQAAISYQIRQLEGHIGRPLFVREKGRARLSDSGRRLLPAISSAFKTIGDAFAAIRSEDDGVLAIQASVSLGATWLSSRIGRFQLRHPDFAVRLSLANEVIDLVASNYDAAIRVGSGQWEGLRSEFLFRQHFTPICAPSFLKQHRITRPEDLLTAERFAPNDVWWTEWFAAAGVETPPLPRRGVVMDNQMQEANAMLVGGFGIGLMSPLFWRTDLESGRLVQPFETLYFPGNAQWLVHSESRVGVRKIERLREWLREEVAADRDFLPAEVWEPL
ncbi:LysR family transcriptional regulator, glycine cleavage system transcriptional activator [Novosphingobium sp. CF614]|uniref:LysR substrate-binding domain-containing protein n=1 Tax=Novosphingobium sp. CF614 TaxID=1884364 RepID=UPI0008ECF9BE|nr:LysR substrate-binding domain-containing protein [Novosphingobium sp. CF614]SFG33291.1 LysR family transcriptional regulator, glycine cleavage system transcriptional activator [Novosphingobium sp. CF614]